MEPLHHRGPTTTHTCAILDVSADTFREIQGKLEQAGYLHVFHEYEGAILIDLHGLALRDEDDDGELNGSSSTDRVQPIRFPPRSS